MSKLRRTLWFVMAALVGLVVIACITPDGIVGTLLMAFGSGLWGATLDSAILVEREVI